MTGHKGVAFNISGGGVFMNIYRIYRNSVFTGRIDRGHACHVVIADSAEHAIALLCKYLNAVNDYGFTADDFAVYDVLGVSKKHSNIVIN